MGAHTPAQSDHIGIAVDLDDATLLYCHLSPLQQFLPCKLSVQNQCTRTSYVQVLKIQLDEHKILCRPQELFQKVKDGASNDTDKP